MAMGDRERFPVLRPIGWPPLPASVPWEVVAGHETQAQETHGQTLKRLAARGGLDPLELWLVAHDRAWGMTQPFPGRAEIVAWVHQVAAEPLRDIEAPRAGVR